MNWPRVYLNVVPKGGLQRVAIIVSCAEVLKVSTLGERFRARIRKTKVREQWHQPKGDQGAGQWEISNHYGRRSLDTPSGKENWLEYSECH